MYLEYLENILQLSAILIALLISLFRYISSRKRGWFFAVAFFLANLLSCYFWTAYLVIMGDTPNVSDGLAYFGWNLGFFFSLCLMIQMKTPKERKYFNVLMLIPIPLNILQLYLYVQFGGVANSVYQVSILTVNACLALQSLLYYAKNRKEGAKPPYVAGTMLVFAFAEFGMWTSSCFSGDVANLYYPFSFLCSISELMFVLALSRIYASEQTEETSMDKKSQNILKLVYAIVAIVCVFGGIGLGIWIRDTLAEGAGTREASVYDVIPIVLFLMSVIIVVAAASVILIVYFEQKMTENRRLRAEKEAAMESEEAKSEMLTEMSHEIRTPLNAVLGMNEMILQESEKAGELLWEEPAKAKELLSDISKYAGYIDIAGKNLLSITDEILEIPERSAALSSEDFQAPDANILVVDDERMDQIVATALLRDTQVHVDIASSGAEALSMSAEKDYDMIFLDQLMPQMDGTETLHRLRIRGESRMQHVPVICLTADAANGAKERYLSRGFTDYLTKPVNGPSLKNMIRKYLPADKIKTSGN